MKISMKSRSKDTRLDFLLKNLILKFKVNYTKQLKILEI